MALNSKSPETAYCSKGNIALPEDERRTPAQVLAAAQTRDADHDACETGKYWPTPDPDTFQLPRKG
jgi:hypothetical protein